MDFSQISVLLVVASTFGIIVRKFKQPILVGYLFAGFLLATTGLIKDHELIGNLGKIGVVLLLFLVGLEMNLREMPMVGKVALFTGLGQVIITFGTFVLAALLLSIDVVPAFYLAIAFTFSSTIIIVKLLSEKKVLHSLQGKITVGILLVQDFVAMLIMIFLPSFSKGGFDGINFIFLVLKAVFLLGAIWFLSKRVLPSLFEKHIAQNPELLFIASIAWALGISTLVAGPLGFTLEIGGFLAGLALSNLPEHLEIAAKTRSLRDFFLTLFFLSLGTNLVIGNIVNVILPAIVFSLLVLILKPVIVLTLIGLIRFKKRTAFLTSSSLAQISEFSLIIVSMGAGMGHIDDNYLTLVILVAALTMTISTYLILDSEKIYLKLKDKLKVFERKNPRDLIFVEDGSYKDHVVVVGYRRTGPRVVSYLKQKKIPYVVVDFNPDVHKKLIADNNKAIFGDISDPDVLEIIDFDRSFLVVSTIDSINDNISILEFIKKLKVRPTTIFTSASRTNAIKLYQMGASYVVVPEVVAGDYIRHLLKIYGPRSARLKKIGQNHFNRLIYT